MKMPNGGFNPAVNVQLATGAESRGPHGQVLVHGVGSRAILSVEVTNEGSDNAGLSEPMRQQAEQRTGGIVQQQLLDGGYMRKGELERAQTAGVELFIPPKKAQYATRRGEETGSSTRRYCRRTGMETANGS
jgi:hypothetical protein